MLEGVDGVVLAVRDAEAATGRFEALFDAKFDELRESKIMGARVATLRCGTDALRLAEPTGPGPVADHLERWGEGIIGVVFSTRDLGRLADHLDSSGVTTTREKGAFHIDASQTHGLHTIIVRHEGRDRVGALSFLYEVTHLVGDWKDVSEFWTKAFGLDGARFSPIASKQYGYEGMLTLFDPPARLDRIEVVTPHDTEKAMGRFFDKRGEGPYMFYAETHDMSALKQRLDAAGARYAAGPDANSSLFVHPSATHGVLIGVSPTDQAWVWSGRPELAQS